MALTLGEFKESLRRAHKRGTTLDADLSGAIRRAALWIEKNHTLQYMRRRFTLDLESGDSEVDVPDVRIKAFLTPIFWTNALGPDGRPRQCVKASFGDNAPNAVWRTTDTVPSQFYLDGIEKIIFNTTYSGGEVLLGEGFLSRFSDFPLEDDEEHWLFEFGESALLVQSMLELGVVNTRDERTYQMYLSHRGDQMQVMLNADAEAQYSGQDISL